MSKLECAFGKGGAPHAALATETGAPVGLLAELEARAMVMPDLKRIDASFRPKWPAALALANHLL